MARSLQERIVRLIQPGGDTDKERVVTQAEFDHMVETRNEAVLRSHSEGPDYITLYDQVDGSPLSVNQQMAMKVHLKKVVSICSACRAPSIWNADVANHIRLAHEHARDHRDARAMTFETKEGSGNRCSACDAVFVSRPRAVHEHIERMKADGPRHEGAFVQVIKRFGLEPPVLEPTRVQAPVASQDDRRQRRRHRRRHRSHKGVRT